MRTLTADYLVVGAGATGMAFTDTLIAESGSDVLLVDRRPSPGGHWCNAYPFLQLHSPSAYYGVNSLALGADRRNRSGPNAGYYEQATGSEVGSYFERVLHEVLEVSGRVRFLGGFEYLGIVDDGHLIRALQTGQVQQVIVRRSVVDARLLEAAIPATHVPTFRISSSVDFVPINELPDRAGEHTSFTVIGAGKTGVDACLWLLANGVEPDRTRWIRPRDAWFSDRAGVQPLDLVAGTMDGISRDALIAADGAGAGEMFERLEDIGRMMRLDDDVTPTMYRGTVLSRPEFDQLRTIEDVVRLGSVQAIEPDRVVLQQGEVAGRPGTLYVDCSARGLPAIPAESTFQSRRIVPQQLRHLSPPFNAALIAFVEAHRTEEEEKNRLCRPNPYPNRPEDWGPMMARTWASERLWSAEPDVSAWVADSRLNLLRALPGHVGEPMVQAALQRFRANAAGAVERFLAPATA